MNIVVNFIAKDAQKKKTTIIMVKLESKSTNAFSILKTKTYNRNSRKKSLFNSLFVYSSI